MLCPNVDVPSHFIVHQTISFNKTRWDVSSYIIVHHTKSTNQIFEIRLAYITSKGLVDLSIIKRIENQQK